MEEIRTLLKSHGINLEITDIESHGFYVPSEKTIFVNQNLTEEVQKEVILHEACHALNHDELAALYNKTVFRLKMENEANSFMINFLIKENDGYFNYSSVLEEFNLGLGWQPK